jgi:AcrR family transcriptional regulator
VPEGVAGKALSRAVDLDPVLHDADSFPSVIPLGGSLSRRSSPRRSAALTLGAACGNRRTESDHFVKGSCKITLCAGSDPRLGKRVATRAGVSERVFHDHFATVEDCYLTTFEKGLRLLSATVAEATRRERSWLARVRAGVVALLGFFDDEPRWARLLLLEAPVGAALALRREQRTLGVLTRLLDDRSVQAVGELTPSPQITSELITGGAFAVIRTRIGGQNGDGEKAGESLVELAPALMSFIVRPYLGETAARAELAGGPALDEAAPSVSGALPIRPTHRTTLVLGAIAAAPRSNNREVAQAAGLSDEGQTSKLLARLERHGLIENVGVGATHGEPNAWLLTPEGHRVVALLDQSFARPTPRRIGRRARGAL